MKRFLISTLAAMGILTVVVGFVTLVTLADSKLNAYANPKPRTEYVIVAFGLHDLHNQTQEWVAQGWEPYTMAGVGDSIYRSVVITFRRTR